jgi:hypothetical protein
MRSGIKDEAQGNAEGETVEEERVRLVPDEGGDGEDATPAIVAVARGFSRFAKRVITVGGCVKAMHWRGYATG